MATRKLSSIPLGRRLAVVLVIAAVGLMTVSFHPPAARADLNGDSVGWHYSEAGNGFYQAPHTSKPDSTEPITFLEWGTLGYYACEQPRAGCAAFTSINCGYSGLPPNGPPVYGYGEWRYTLATAADETNWDFVTIDCVPTPEWVPLAEVGYQFQFEIERLLPKPTIDLRPEPETLVNLPTIVSTDYPADKTFDITVPPSAGRTIPLHGSINAHADFTWTFEDGTTTSGAGHAYDGTDPTTNPDYYLTDTFRTAGHHTVTLTVTWTGTITVETLAPEAFDPVTFQATAGVDVVESHPVLTAP